MWPSMLSFQCLYCAGAVSKLIGGDWTVCSTGGVYYGLNGRSKVWYNEAARAPPPVRSRDASTAYSDGQVGSECGSADRNPEERGGGVPAPRLPRRQCGR